MTSIHQEIRLPARPSRIYDAYMDAKEHATFTAGGAVTIDPAPGGAFSTHGGVISGRTIELVPNQRIVQAWRVGNWPEGVYSIVRIELVADGDGTKLVLDHAGFPEDQGKHLDQGWHARYWEPLRKHLAS
ncbi:MAG TPA: SRPBCC family protein [Labilithrix sp.]|jgi:uncharacterized protein YndB with AHSA1/START domain